MMTNTSHRVQRFLFSSFESEDSLQQSSSDVLELQLPVHLETISEPPVVFEQQQELAQLITEQMLQDAREQSRLQGYHEGVIATHQKMNQESRDREDKVHNLLEVISNRVTLAAETHSHFLQQSSDLLQKTTLLIARKIAGDAMKRDPIAAVESLLKECIAIVCSEPRITICVSPNLANSVRMHCDTLRALLSGFSGEILIDEDATLEDQDCRVEWNNGHAERNTQSMWNEIEQIVGQKIINS